MHTGDAEGIPDDSGSGVSDGVGEGSDGDGVIDVGIGDGGSVKIGVGDGAEVASMAGAGDVGSALAATRRGIGIRVAGRGDHSTGVTGRGFKAWVGAVPRAPTPSGADTGLRGAAGAPNSQPMMMANGRPRTRTYKNSNLGVSRTHEHRSWRGKVTVCPSPVRLH